MGDGDHVGSRTSPDVPVGILRFGELMKDGRRSVQSPKHCRAFRVYVVGWSSPHNCGEIHTDTMAPIVASKIYKFSLGG